jgi:hypothetical protein
VEAEGRRAADAVEKKRSKQRPPDEASEVNEVKSGAQAPDRTTGPTPAGTAPCGRPKEPDIHPCGRLKNHGIHPCGRPEEQNHDPAPADGPTNYTALTSPPSIRNTEPVIHRAPGDTKNAINSAISSGSPYREIPAS